MVDSNPPNTVPEEFWPLIARLSEESSAGIMLLDPHGRIVWENDAGKELLGLPTDQASPVLGQRITSLPNVREAGAAPVFEAILEGTSVHDVIVDLVSVSGQPVTFRVDGGPVYDDDGYLIGAWTMARDSVRRTEQAGRLLEIQRMEILGLSVTGVIHDLNNVLTGLGGTLELLGSGGEVSGDLFSALDNMVRRSHDITQRLLEVARPGNQPMESMDLRTPIRQAADLMRHGLGPSVQVECTLPDTQLPVHASRTSLLQCLFNLGTNARDAMDGRGRITLQVTRVEDPERSATHNWPTDFHALLEVTDTGPGIPADQMGRIFEPFFTTKGGSGTGMGLAVVHRSVMDHRGGVAVSNGPDGGARFAVRIPLQAGRVIDDEPTRNLVVPCQLKTQGPPLDGMRILVADDESALRMVLAQGLRMHGAEVELAVDGIEALDAAQHGVTSGHPFHAAVVDMHMPGLDGVELLGALSARVPGIRILATSGLDPSGSTMGELEDLEVRFLGKPFRLAHVVELLLTPPT